MCSLGLTPKMRYSSSEHVTTSARTSHSQPPMCESSCASSNRSRVRASVAVRSPTFASSVACEATSDACARLRSAVTAASSRPITAPTPTKVCATSRLTSALSVVTGPTPLAVLPTAITAITRLTTAAPACENRRPAQIGSGSTT